VIQHYSTISVGDRQVMAMISGVDDLWAAVAIEMPHGGSAKDFLTNHAHVDLGKFKSLALAQKAAQKFMGAWAKGKNKPAKCACPEIGSPLN